VTKGENCFFFHEYDLFRNLNSGIFIIVPEKADIGKEVNHMTKFVKGLLAGTMALTRAACSNSSAADEQPKEETPAETAETETAEAETAVAAYKITNNTGETVKLSVTNNEGKLDAFEKELKDGESASVEYGEVDASLSFTVLYTTESGREGKFETLHAEEANISLLKEDDMTGSTPLAFVME
jgi:hypothetical protein